VLVELFCIFGEFAAMRRLSLALSTLLTSAAVVLVPWAAAAPDRAQRQDTTENSAVQSALQSFRPDSRWKEATTDATPPCPSHEPSVYHGLFDPVGQCHYDHEHHDNPYQADAVFGPPGAWYGRPHETISYPWQTFNAQTGALENDVKHNGYKWLVQTDDGCRSRFTDNPGCITDYRVEVHALATTSDAVVRHHSFQVEARGCMGDQCGTIRTGGWHDYGQLHVVGADDTVSCVELPDAPCSKAIEERQPAKTHSSLEHASFFANWYGDFPNVTVQLHLQEFGPIDPANPTRQLYFACPEGGVPPDPPRTAAAPCASGEVSYNGSQARLENLVIQLDANDPFVKQYSDAAGRVTFHGYMTRYGQLAETCTGVGLDCVPFFIDQLPQGKYWWRGGLDGSNGRDYDLSPLRSGRGKTTWIKESN
jgi:hypothetical protein